MENKGESALDTHTWLRAGLGPRASFQKGAAQRSLRVEQGRDSAGGDFAGAIGHIIGHLKDIGNMDLIQGSWPVWLSLEKRSF
jgi:hypothetical protein